MTGCPGCDLLLEKKTISEGKRVRCPRCGTVIRKSVENSLQKSLAVSLAGLILFFPAMFMDIMTFTVAGLQGSGNMFDSVTVLMSEGYLFVAFMVLLVSIVFPFLKLGLLFTSSLSAISGRVSPATRKSFRLYNHLQEWGMVEVYLLGILVSIIKMYSMADISYDTGFFCFVGLVILAVASSTVVDEDSFWDAMGEARPEPQGESVISTALLAREETALSAGLVSCEECGKLSRVLTVSVDEVMRCRRCLTLLHSRKPGSISRTWALLITSAVLFLPANILPMMRVNFMGAIDDSTILDGIMYFFHDGDYFIGSIILIASVLVPLFKIVGILIILLSIHFHQVNWLEQKTMMFRFIEFIGRWSFLDIFVIGLLASLVRFGTLSTIEASPAIVYFTAVVVSTMFAALALDPRIIWDAAAHRKNTRVSNV